MEYPTPVLSKKALRSIDTSEEACYVVDAVFEALVEKYGNTIPHVLLSEEAENITLTII